MNATITVPAGSALWHAVPREETPDGILITADTCSNSREHDGPYLWHFIVPERRGGKAETGNLMSLCRRCHDNVTSMVRVMEQHTGPDTFRGEGIRFHGEIQVLLLTAAQAFKAPADEGREQIIEALGSFGMSAEQAADALDQPNSNVKGKPCSANY